MVAPAPKHKSYKKAVVALIIANIIWGMASPIFKWSLRNIPPFSLAFSRFYFASLILALVLLIKRISSSNSESLRILIHRVIKFDGKNLLWLALSGITLNITFFFLGLKISPAINAPVIASAGPVFSFLLAVLFLGEPFKWKKFLGMMVALFGVFFIIIDPILKSGGLSSSSLGDLFFVLATLAACAQSIFGKKVYSNHDFLIVTFLTFVIGALTFLPLAYLEYVKNTLWIAQLDERGLSGIVYGAVFSSAIAYSLLGFGLSIIPASETVIYTYIDPINAVLIAMPLLGEKITFSYLFGSFFVILGIYLAEKRLHYHPFEKLRDKLPMF